MGENIKVEMPIGKPSHRMFQVSPTYPLSQSYPKRRERQRMKKLFTGNVLPSLLGDTVEQPSEQLSKGNSERSARRRAYNAKKARAN